jgi:hypothetical protein
MHVLRHPPLRRRARLDGVWKVERTGGFLPPMLGVRKVIDGGRGRTTLGPLLGPAYEVYGRELRYVRPFGLFVDVLTRIGGGCCDGRATVLARTFGTFRMRRLGRRSEPGSCGTHRPVRRG